MGVCGNVCCVAAVVKNSVFVFVGLFILYVGIDGECFSSLYILCSTQKAS